MRHLTVASELLMLNPLSFGTRDMATTETRLLESMKHKIKG